MPDPETIRYDKANEWAKAKMATEQCMAVQDCNCAECAAPDPRIGESEEAMGMGAMMRPPQLEYERGKLYGPWEANMRGTSMQHSGLLIQYRASNPKMNGLPSWWTPLTQCVLKLNRIASGNYHPDNFIDLHLYVDFIERMQKRGG